MNHRILKPVICTAAIFNCCLLGAAVPPSKAAALSPANSRLEDSSLTDIYKLSDWINDSYDVHGQVATEDLATWENGLGSAAKLDGNIVIVSIFADDDRSYWNFDTLKDWELRSRSLDYLALATEWIAGQGHLWGADPVFFYDWSQDADLYYEMELDADVTSDYDDPTDSACAFIEESIDSDALLQKYQAQSIVYLAYLNTPLRNRTTSYTIPYDDSLDDPYEICYLLLGCDGEEETPAAYAHEILHTFGAPDLYTSDNPEYNYNINDAFVHFCEVRHANDIMMTTYDVDTDEAYYDRITNELTDLTAYYIGWIDSCPEARSFHLQESQHSSGKD